jgi:alpha-tubulin suppressor-like RCC1 family protein
VSAAVVAAAPPAAAGPASIVEAWGYNAYGQLGNGTTTESTTPVAVDLPAGVTATSVAAGGYHSLAIGSNGTVYAWGDNGLGQLGNGTTTNSSTPVAVSVPSGVTFTAIAAGLDDSLALGSNGKVYAWGDNSFDELGNGSTASDSTVPVAVSLPAGVTATAIAAGQYHSLAIGSNGTLYAWGYNNDGQLGNGKKATPSTPVAVSMPSGVTATKIAAGGYHSLAVGSNGDLYSWGYNVDGQLGNGTTTLEDKPVVVSLPSGVSATSLSAGLYFSLAIGSNGDLYSWGYNADGELGDGAAVNSSTPVAVTLPAHAAPSQISTGLYDSLALATNGTLYAWGQNGYGQLGDGSTTTSLSPTTVTFPQDATFTGLASDSSSIHSVAIATPSQAVTTTTLTPSSTSPTYGQAETLTATVTGSDGSGTVDFAQGTTTLPGCGSVTLSASGSEYQAQCTTSTLAAGPYALSATYSGDAASLGSTAPTVDVTVAQAPLVVTASSQAITYGGTPVTPSASYAGFVNGDTASSLSTAPTCTTTATSTSPADTYPTSCSGAAAANYSITYDNGEVVVAPAPLSISASSGTMTYGGSVPTVTPSYVGFVNGDSATSLTSAPVCSTTAGSTSPVGSYPSSCTGASDPNYTISYTVGQVVVGAAPLVVTASSVATTYGTAPTAITPSYSGFLNGDDASSLTTQPSCTSTDDATSPVGTYSATCSGASDPNYSITYVSGSVTVNPAPVTITASSGSMTYGGDVPGVTPTVDGLQNGEGASVLGDELQCSTTAASVSPVGTYGTSCSGASDSNYAITYVSGSVTVNPAPVTVTASSGSMTYGGNVPGITPTVDGLQNGEGVSVLGAGFGCSTVAVPTSPVGTYDSSCSGDSDADYTVTYVDGTVTVDPASLTITASSESTTYGDDPGAITPLVTGLQNNEDISVLGAGLMCSTSAVQSSPVGSYASTCSGAVDPNYTIVDIDGSVSVNPAPLTITASSDTATYGGATPAITASYTGFVNGDDDTSLATPPACTTDATPSSAVGTYVSSCSGAVDGNYDITYVDGAVVVGQADLIVVASDGSMTYGGTPPTVTASYVGFANGDDATSLTTPPVCTTDATPTSAVGSYASSCSGAVDGNYDITYVDGSTTVAPAPLTVTASSGSISYGGASPDISPSYSGFANGDSESSLTTPASCSSGVLPTSPVGTYASSCSGAQDANYDISYVDGTVAVTPAALTVTASSDSTTYGSPVPAITSTIAGLQNGEGASVLGTALSCSTGATPSSPVGSYATNCSGASDPNYTVAYVAGELSVSPAALTVTASSGSFAYGAQPPSITPTVSGLQNGEDPSVLGGALTCSTTATSSSPVGTYPSSCSGASDANYAISYVDNTVQVVAAPLTVAASSGSMTYGGAVPAIDPTYSGFVDGDGPAELGTPPTCSTTATSNSPVGTYASSCSGAADPNYSISYVPGNVVVGASALVISASSGSMTYGGASPSVTPTYSGFVNGDGPGSLTTAPTCSDAAGATSPVGSYATTCSGASDPNYTISYVSGAVHVVPAPLTVSASSAAVTYGGSAPAIVPTVTGLVNGQGVSVLGSGLTCTTSAGPTSPVGSYSSTCSGASDPNYAVSYASGTVTVSPATLTVTAQNQTMQFGSTVPTLTSTITGYVDGQTLATSGVTGQPVCTTTATSMSPAGSYPITCVPGTLTATNYTFSFVAGTLTVVNTTTLACLTIGSVTVSAGQSVKIAPGCAVLGSVTVKAGGSLDSEGGLVIGSVVSTGGSVRMCSSSLALVLTVTKSTLPLVVGNGTSSCGGSTLIGGVTLSSNTGGVSLERAGAIGVIGVTGNSGGVNVTNNTVLGILTVTGNTGSVVDRPNTVIGLSDLQ